MVVIILLVALSLVLVVAGLFFFGLRLRDGDFEHGDRLSLLPLEEDEIAEDGAGNQPLAPEEGDTLNGNQ